MAKISPILLMEAIEPALPFWVERLGGCLTVQVPGGGAGRLVFAIVELGGAEVMLQTWASVQADPAAAGAVGDPLACRAVLFIEVPDFAEIERKLAGYPIAVAPHDTFYGMRELAVAAPGGHLVTFAAPLAQAS